MISVGEVIYRIQENPLLKAVKTSDIVNHVKTILELIGVPGVKEEKQVNLVIQDFRCQLPLDFLERVTVRLVDSVSKTPIVVLGHSSDDCMQFTVNSSTVVQSDTLYSHRIVNGFIYTDFKEGEVELIYTAYHTDINGWPMIPSNTSVILAIEFYIKARYFRILSDQNAQFERAWAEAEKQYCWYIAQATNSMLHLDPVEAQALGNALVRMIPIKDAFYSNNKYSSQPEKLNKSIW
jgi:hypothetical protein